MDDGFSAEDVVEQGQGRRRLPSLNWRPSRGASVLAAVALVAGLGAGYAAGDRQARGSAAPPAPSPTPTAAVPSPAVTFHFSGSPALAQDTGTCSAQRGRDLQLGVQVTNQSGAPVTLRGVRSAVLAAGWLTPVAQQRGPCGTLSAGLEQGTDVLPPGASTWFAFTFKVLRGCPRPVPVRFTVAYAVQGHAATASLPGFSDLSGVPYSGCTPSS